MPLPGGEPLPVYPHTVYQLTVTGSALPFEPPISPTLTLSAAVSHIVVPHSHSDLNACAVLPTAGCVVDLCEWVD